MTGHLLGAAGGIEAVAAIQVGLTVVFFIYSNLVSCQLILCYCLGIIILVPGYITIVLFLEF